MTLSWVVRHPLWDTIGLPLLAALYVRRKDISAIPKQLRWQFQTKLQQGADLVAWAAAIALAAGKRLWVVADGAYAKRASWRSWKPSPTGRRSSKTSTTSR